MNLGTTIAGVGATFSRGLARSKFLIKAKSPEILLAVGIISMVGATATAIVATRKVDSILEGHSEKIDAIHDLSQSPEIMAENELTDASIRMSVIGTHITTGAQLAKHYIVPIALTTIGVVSILASYKIMMGRHVALLAGYNALFNEYNQYRQRVIADVGEDKDAEYANLPKAGQTSVELYDECGKKVEVSELGEFIRWFDEANPNYTRRPEQNAYWLKGMETAFNHRLNIDGFVLFNDVLHDLGFNRTEMGCFMGWYKNKNMPDYADTVIDFGLLSTAEDARAFMNGDEAQVALRFNVQGVVSNLI